MGVSATMRDCIALPTVTSVIVSATRDAQMQECEAGARRSWETGEYATWPMPNTATGDAVADALRVRK